MSGFWRSRVLPPLPPPLRDHWVVAEVALHEAVVISDTLCAGYRITLGVRSAPERLRHVVDHGILDGRVVWNETTSSTDVSGPLSDATIRKRVTPVSDEGIWYRTGRIFFPRDEST